MLDIAIMLEGQNGLNWPRFQKIARAVEELGFSGLYRSDHYTNSGPPDLDSLELWVSLTWLASHTERIEFGPLVSPVSFRQPTMTVRMAAAVDDLSAGRLQLGLGAGWQEREHHNYSWDLLGVKARMDRFEEGLEVVTRMLNSAEPITYEGEYYRIYDAVLLPRPQRPGGPPIVIGGNGPKRTLPLAAKYADEWNAVFLPRQRWQERNTLLDEFIEANGRALGDVRRSMMTGLFFGYDGAEVEARAATRGRTAQETRDLGAIFGTASEIVDQIGELQEAGLERIMLQWLDLDDLDRLADMAQAVLPHFTP